MRVDDPKDHPGNRKQKGMPKGMANASCPADKDPALNILRQQWRAWKRMNPLRQWRLQNMMNIEAAAAALRVPYGTYLNWESGQKFPREEIFLVDEMSRRSGKARWDDHMFKSTGVRYIDYENWAKKNPLYGRIGILKRLMK